MTRRSTNYAEFSWLTTSFPLAESKRYRVRTAAVMNAIVFKLFLHNLRKDLARYPSAHASLGENSTLTLDEVAHLLMINRHTRPDLENTTRACVNGLVWKL